MRRKRPPAPPPERRITPPGRAITILAIFLSGCGVVLVIGGLLTWFNHANPQRTNDRIRPFPSPDGKREAVLFRRTTLGEESPTTHVALIAAGEKLPNRSGKAFIAEGEPDITLRWIDNNHLFIDDPDGTKVILRAAKVGNVRISGN